MRLGQTIVCPLCKAELDELAEPDSTIRRYMSIARPGDRFVCGSCCHRTIEYTPDGVRPAAPPWENRFDVADERDEFLLRLRGAKDEGAMD